MTSKRDPNKTIQEYLEKQNRPYSATDIFQNLHKEFGKTAVVKALESLAEQRKVIEKTYGKQKVYGPCQEKFGDIKPEELKALDTKAADLQEKLSKLKSEVHAQDSEISSFSKQMTTQELDNACKTLKERNMELTSKINKIKNGRCLISKEDRQKIKVHTGKMVTHWKKRKRMTTDMMDCILEGYPKTKKHLIDETGVETDEEIGIKIPT
ncbi:homologous-pairing protein 2 homolog [Clytia hemisphaerica]|uniref:homologous-pairing protein 2 homolog n=1 Tax=Clytia hemisphaerica TaxID=252671 RepID=UPI0034D69347